MDEREETTGARTIKAPLDSCIPPYLPQQSYEVKHPTLHSAEEIEKKCLLDQVQGVQSVIKCEVCSQRKYAIYRSLRAPPGPDF